MSSTTSHQNMHRGWKRYCSVCRTLARNYILRYRYRFIMNSRLGPSCYCARKRPSSCYICAEELGIEQCVIHVRRCCVQHTNYKDRTFNLLKNSLKIISCHFTNLVVTGGIAGFHNDNMCPLMALHREVLGHMQAQGWPGWVCISMA